MLLKVEWWKRERGREVNCEQREHTAVSQYSFIDSDFVLSEVSLVAGKGKETCWSLRWWHQFKSINEKQIQQQKRAADEKINTLTVNTLTLQVSAVPHVVHRPLALGCRPNVVTSDSKNKTKWQTWDFGTVVHKNSGWHHAGFTHGGKYIAVYCWKKFLSTTTETRGSILISSASSFSLQQTHQVGSQWRIMGSVCLKFGQSVGDSHIQHSLLTSHPLKMGSMGTHESPLYRNTYLANYLHGLA